MEREREREREKEREGYQSKTESESDTDKKETGRQPESEREREIGSNKSIIDHPTEIIRTTNSICFHLIPLCLVLHQKLTEFETQGQKYYSIFSS